MPTYTRRIALFASLMSIFIFFSIHLYRIGFESPTEPMLKSIGLLTIIIYLPIYIFSKQNVWWQNHLFGSFIMVFLLSFLGYFCHFFPVLSFISYVLAGLGIIFFLKAVFEDFKKFSWQQITGIFFLSVILGTYLLAYFYSKNTNSAIFAEVIAFSEPLLDSVYHSAVAKMIQTYQVLTTGVEGLVSMNYNVISHWLFAQISLLLDIDIVSFYHLLNPIIIFPFFVYTFLSLVSQVYLHLSKYFFENSSSKLFSIPFWIILFCLLFPIPDSIYARGLLGYHFFQSLVYPTSLVFLWCFASVCLSYAHNPKYKSVFEWFVFPICLFLLAYTHVAVGVAIVSAAGYLFLRLRLFQSLSYWFWILLQAGILFFAYWLIAETNFAGQVRSYEGSFEWFFFFRQEGFVWWDFLLGLYLPLILLTLLYWQKFRSKGFAENKTLFLEILWAVALGGLAPNMILALYGSTSMYFMSVQRLLAGVLLLSFIPFLDSFWLFWQKKYARYVAVVLILGFTLLFYMSYRNVLNDSWKDNLSTRKNITQIQDFDWKANHFVEKLFSDDKDWAKAKKLFSTENQKIVAQNGHVKFIQAIKSLDSLPISEKSQSLLYIPFHKINLSHFDNNKFCIQTPIYLAAISGVALLGGLPKPACGVGAYGYGYLDFTWRDKAWKEGLSKTEIIKIAKQRGFKYVYCFKPENYSFEKIICKNP